MQVDSLCCDRSDTPGHLHRVLLLLECSPLTLPRPPCHHVCSKLNGVPMERASLTTLSK